MTIIYNVFAEIMNCILLLNSHLLVFVVLMHVRDGFHQVFYMKLKVEKWRCIIYYKFLITQLTVIKMSCLRTWSNNSPHPNQLLMHSYWETCQHNSCLNFMWVKCVTHYLTYFYVSWPIASLSSVKKKGRSFGMFLFKVNPPNKVFNYVDYIIYTSEKYTI